ncbi:MAG: hypothetical protein OHK0032_12890 [Thermodesulfovibrionales bacterium]
MRYFSAHLPVMATWRNTIKGHQPSSESLPDSEREDVLFPVNMTVKGIGLIPKAEMLNDYADIFEGVIAEARTMPWDESLHKRAGVMLRLYGDINNFDPALLGGLEIFEGRAFENLKRNPYASLLYMGMSHTIQGMQYTSFQVNGKVEILEKANAYYRFLLASRKLFEFDRFHLYQPDYPFGYLIRVMEVRDKSPWSRNHRT